MRILNLNRFVNEKMKIVPLSDDDFDNISPDMYNYHPETKDELRSMIYERMQKDGNECDLNDIDVSKITDMLCLFANWDCGHFIWINNLSDFNGNISEWNVSNVVNMECMFQGAESFNKNISKWDVSNVENMKGMFSKAASFNQDISGWDVSKVSNTEFMFDEAESFNQDLSGWNLSKANL